MTKDFIEKRIEEQHDYLIKVQDSDICETRKSLIMNSAYGQLDYFTQKLKQMNKSSVECVKEFHEMFEHPIGLDPSHIEPLKIRQLRVKILFEELAELAEAGDVEETYRRLCFDYNESKTEWISETDQISIVKDGDSVNKMEELDAITDIQYVLDGKKLTSGLHTVTDEAFKLIHDNNMNKAHRDMDHAIETVSKNNMVNYSHKIKNGLYLLYNSDLKLTKPWDHKKVDLSHLVQ